MIVANRQGCRVLYSLHRTELIILPRHSAHAVLLQLAVPGAQFENVKFEIPEGIVQVEMDVGAAGVTLKDEPHEVDNVEDI